MLGIVPIMCVNNIIICYSVKIRCGDTITKFNSMFYSIIFSFPTKPLPNEKKEG